MSEDLTERVYQYPATVVRPLHADELRALALEKRIFDDASLQKYNPYFFPAEISSSRLDSHSTRMAPSTLKNYAAEAEAGVSFLYSHDCRELVGKSMGGKFVNAQGDGVARVTADLYVIPSLQLGAVSGEQIVTAIDSNVLTDVSVGFYGGRWMCSICGFDIWDWEECSHYPGMTFKVQADGQTREELCIADVEDAHLAEVSGVYKGSTPGAMIAKANRQALDGQLEPKTRLFLERHLRIHLPEKRVIIPGHTQENDMPEEDKTKTPPATPDPPDAADGERELVSVRALAKEAGIPDDFPTVAEGFQRMTNEIKRLRPLADEGTAYRKDLTEVALREAVRAGFSKENYTAILSRASVDEIKQMIIDFGAKGDEIFLPGRQTVDASEEPSKPTKRTAPAAAYAV